MLFKFKSRATADLIMLEANGRQVLKIVGKRPEPHGIITLAQIPETIALLEAAVTQDELAQQASDGDAQEQELQEPVRLRQRVAPFVEMLRRAAAAETDVVW